MKTKSSLLKKTASTNSFISPSAFPLFLVLIVQMGLGIRKAAEDDQDSAGAEGAQVLARGVRGLSKVFERVLGWLVHLVPLAVFGVVAQMVGKNGFAPFAGLAWYVGVSVAGLVLHSVIVYHGWLLVLRVPLRTFWKHASKPVVYALGANSSLATLPLTLEALSNLGVSKKSSTLCAAVLSNFNNDGIILYEGAAVLFVAQV